MSISVAIQLYSVRDDIEKDLVGTLKAIKSYGYDGVELCGLYGNAPEYVAQILEEIGLTPVSSHVGLNDMRVNPEKIINDYKIVGCHHLTIPWLEEVDRPQSGNFDKTVEDIARIGEIVKNSGMTLSYHNHDFEFAKIGDVYALDYLYSKVSEDFLQAEIDVCWVSNSGENAAEYIGKYNGRLPLLHLKDYVGQWKKEGFEFRPVGHGVQDIKSICETAREGGTTWFIVEQDRPSKDKTPLECAKLSREYLKSIGY